MVGYNKLGNILQALVLPLENYDKTKSYSYKNGMIIWNFFSFIDSRKRGREGEKH